MITAAELKKYSSLLRKKFREEENKFLIEGEKLLYEALSAGTEIITVMKQLSTDISPGLLSLLAKKKIPLEDLRSDQFRKLTDTVNSQGIVAVVNSAGIKKKDLKRIDTPVVLLLSNISDPGNMGTILRTALWFGVKEVILSGDCVEIFNPKVVRSAMGAIFKLNFYELRPEEITIMKETGYRICVSDMNGKDVNEVKKHGKTVLVMNNESRGPDPVILSVADDIVSIPGKGDAESLNVAVSAAVLLFALTN